MDMIDQKGARLIYAKMFTMTYGQIERHYSHHEGKDFWDDLVGYLTDGPSIALVYRGEKAPEAIRQLIGQKHPTDSPPGSIRGKYALSFPQNLIHGADSESDANREMQIFFTTKELEQIYGNQHLC
jgi:nucleoside-diphosphate kinase